MWPECGEKRPVADAVPPQKAGMMRFAAPRRLENREKWHQMPFAVVKNGQKACGKKSGTMRL